MEKLNCNIHTLGLSPIYFDLVKNGEKVLEGRLNDQKRQKFNIGDKIVFYKEPQRVEFVEAVILDKYLYNNFDIMAENLNKADLGFKNQTKQEMIDCYRSFYNKEDEIKFGVVIFKIKKL